MAATLDERLDLAGRVTRRSADLPQTDAEWDLHEGHERMMRDLEPEVSDVTAEDVAAALARVQAAGDTSMRRASHRRGETPSIAETGETTIDGKTARTTSRRSSSAA